MKLEYELSYVRGRSQGAPVREGVFAFVQRFLARRGYMLFVVKRGAHKR